VQQKLVLHRPQTLGQASRIQGVTPAAISILLVHLKRGQAGAPGERVAGPGSMSPEAQLAAGPGRPRQLDLPASAQIKAARLSGSAR
jgi:hypothetical protein